MLDTLISLYNYSLDLPILFKRFRIDSLLRRSVEIISSWIIPICFRLKLRDKRIMCDGLVRERKIIVSLTSFPARIDYVWLTIESMMRQSVLPNKIVLWLSEKQFPTIDSLPSSLTNLCEFGLDIRFVKNDYRSHKKYLYAFKEFANDYVVLIDDDILYPSCFLEELLNGITLERVHCSYGSIMKFDTKGSLQPYSQWKSAMNMTLEDNNFFFGSGGGTAFIPSTLYPDVCNAELAYRLCPTADDVWLNAMCRLNQLKCIKVRKGLIFPIHIKNNQKLCTTNVVEAQNDQQIQVIRNYYLEKIGIDPFMVVNNN